MSPLHLENMFYSLNRNINQGSDNLQVQLPSSENQDDQGMFIVKIHVINFINKMNNKIKYVQLSRECIDLI